MRRQLSPLSMEPLEEDTDLQVEELAVASVDDLGTAIAPAHLDNVNLLERQGHMSAVGGV